MSGSSESEHEEGTTNRFVARLAPYGMVLGPDGQVDVFSFSDGKDAAHYIGTVTPETSEAFVLDLIVGRGPGWKGGTTYRNLLERNLQHFGWLLVEALPQGFFSRFSGMAPQATVIFITDGENDPSNMDLTSRILQTSQDRGDEVYFLFMVACAHEVEFKCLHRIARSYSSTGVVIINDLDAYVELSDEELDKRLLVPELIDWLRK